MKHLIKLLGLSILILGVLQCERDDRFYRPRVPQKLSVLAVIDADDSLRFIRLEKTFQAEYPEDLTDSLRDLSFTISDSKREIYSFKSNQALTNNSIISIPDSIEFMSGENYFFWAKERDCPEVFSEIMVPDTPSQVEILSITKEKVSNLVSECELFGEYDAVLDVIRFSIGKSEGNNTHYAILIISEGFGAHSSIKKSYADFSVRATNTTGFFATFPGLITYNLPHCMKGPAIRLPANAYLVDKNNIPENGFIMEIAVQSMDYKALPDIITNIRIKLISIPEKMFLVEKNFYTYKNNLNNPFSEPVYVQGNILGGTGYFAICKSSVVNVNTPFPHWPL